MHNSVDIASCLMLIKGLRLLVQFRSTCGEMHAKVQTPKNRRVLPKPSATTCSLRLIASEVSQVIKHWPRKRQQLPPTSLVAAASPFFANKASSRCACSSKMMSAENKRHNGTDPSSTGPPPLSLPAILGAVGAAMLRVG